MTEPEPPGYRLPPPDPASIVQWPDSFGRRVLLTVDTEEEFDWTRPFSRDRHTLATPGALPEAQQRLSAMGFRPGFFCSYPVLRDAGGAAILRSLLEVPGAAIGAQLHAWVTPPFDEPLGPVSSFAGNLPVALEAAKLDALTAAVEVVTGRRPLAFRSGRYGIGPATLALLAERGYRLDSSIRARHDYGAEGGPDFRAVGIDAFHAGGLLCLPLTTVFTGFGRAGGSRLYDVLGRVALGRSLASRSGLFSRVALTPEGMPFADAAEAVRVALGEGHRLLHFAFHSPSLVPGHTPYTPDAPALVRFWRWWDRMAALLDRLGVRGIGLEELIGAADPGTAMEEQGER